MDSRVVHFEGSDEDDSYVLHFPGGEQLQVTAEDVGRSRLLRDLLGSAVEAGEATLTFPSCVELSHLRTWAAAVQPDSSVLQEDAESMGKCLVAVDFLADEGLMQRVLVAYAERLFPPAAAEADSDFLRVLEGLREEHASMVLAASGSCVGARAWLLPTRLHPLDEAISTAALTAQTQRSTPHGQKVVVHPDGHSMHDVAVAPHGQLFATSSTIGHVALWHADTGMHVRTLQDKRGVGPVRGLAWSPDSSLLATTSDSSAAKVWDVASGSVKHMLTWRGCAVWCVAWSPDGLTLCTGMDGYSWCEASLWDVATGAVVRDLEGHIGCVKAVDWSPEGSFVATGSSDSTVRVWDAATGAAVQSLHGHRKGVTRIAWSPDGSMLAACSRCKGDRLRLWEAATGAAKHTLAGCPAQVFNSVAWSPDGRHLATGAVTGKLTLWEMATSTSIRVIKVPECGWWGVKSVAWSPCAGYVFAATDRESVHISSTREAVAEVATARTSGHIHRASAEVSDVAAAPVRAVTKGSFLRHLVKDLCIEVVPALWLGLLAVGLQAVGCAKRCSRG